MRIISFLSQKGGCGKSTLAASLGVAAKEAGEKVTLLDLDPKRSLYRWGVKRTDRGRPVRTVSPANLPAVLNSLRMARKVTLVIVDTPALESLATTAALQAAHFSIVPARPATFDIWASEVTGRKMKLMNKEFAFLLNQCPSTRNNLHMQESISSLESIGNLFYPYIHQREVFLDAISAGKGVTEVDPNGLSSREIQALWKALKLRLPKSQTTR
ncbi:MAG: ParA family protein [Alphaproteobacteria bacterium]|nr:ParA family protein [Alphaproteobacteria bacterium]